MSEVDNLNMSQLSLSSSGSEDWDRSMILDPSSADPSSSSSTHNANANATTTPRNSVVFPNGLGGAEHDTPRSATTGRDKRSLSELLRLHAEKGTDCHFSTEEAARVADVLGQWINAGSSPYEGEDDFFMQRSQDDLSLPSRRSPLPESAGRSRGQSESANGSRPPSSAGTRS